MISKDELLRLIMQQISQYEIAKMYNVSQPTVSNWFKKYNLKSNIKTGGAINIKDLTGKIFGKLTVKKYIKTGSHGKEYLCQCECGNEKIYRGSTLTSGKISGCGCNIGKGNIGKKHIHYALSKIGEKYNYLTIIDVDTSEVRINKLICRCDCGKLTKQIYADLKTGKVKSCGCNQKEQASITGSKIGLNNFKNNYDWYFIKDNKKFKCRSGYEVIYANYLIENNIEFEYEPKCFKLGNGKRYTPDFYLLEVDEYIEIKGSIENGKNTNQKENVSIFQETHNWMILYWEDLVKKCNLPLKTYHSYLRRARKLNISEEYYLANGLYKSSTT